MCVFRLILLVLSVFWQRFLCAPLVTSNSILNITWRIGSITGKVNNMKLLLKKNCNDNQSDRWGQTPLFIASGYKNIVKVPINHRCAVNKSDFKGRTPLHAACRRKNSVSEFDRYALFFLGGQLPKSFPIEVVKLLLENGCDVDHLDCKQQTALHFACQRGYTDIVSLLIQYRCNIDQTDEYHRTALHYACEIDHTEIVKFLVDHGCNQNITDCDGQTAIDICKKKSFTELVDILSSLAS